MTSAAALICICSVPQCQGLPCCTGQLFASVVKQALRGLQQLSDFDSHPDMADGTYLLISRAIRYSPGVVLNAQMLPLILQASMASLLVQHSFVNACMLSLVLNALMLPLILQAAMAGLLVQHRGLVDCINIEPCVQCSDAASHPISCYDRPACTAQVSR